MREQNSKVEVFDAYSLEKSKEMTSVRIKFRKSSLKDKEGVLYFQLIHNRKAKLITSRFRVFSWEWDVGLSEIIMDDVDSERCTYLQNVKRGLESEVQKIRELISVLEKQHHYAVRDLAEYYVSHSFNGYLFPFIHHLIKKRRTEGKTKTASIYETVQRSFSRFLLGEDIRIERIDGLLMQQYETYLNDNGLCANSISCYMRALRAVYNQAVGQGLAISKNPFKEVYTGIDKTNKRAVNEDVILRLLRLDLSKSASLSWARDLFLFSFFTRGMSFIDMANLRHTDLRNGYIVYARSKTKQVLTIKIEKCIEDIIERHKGRALDAYILPIYSAQNRDYRSHLRTYNKRLRRISEMLDMEKPLSSYVSRHSWATIAFRKGISVQVISEGLGHEDEKTTRIYLASMDQSVIDSANAQIIAL